MEKIPHKSTWKEKRKKEEEAPMKPQFKPEDIDVQEKIEKIKKYAKISAIMLVGSLVVFFIYAIASLFIIILAVYVIVFLIYFPLSELLKKEKK